VPLTPGLVATAEMIVTERDTALARKTGDVPVLSTPGVIRLAEEATVVALEGRLDEGATTVGYRVQLDHLAPVAVGETVHAEAVLETVAGRRLTFRVAITDRRGLVAAGRITRVVVERSRFLDRAAGT
jgi:fluoroacetyl-CoA thioesterase